MVPGRLPPSPPPPLYPLILSRDLLLRVLLTMKVIKSSGNMPCCIQTQPLEALVLAFCISIFQLYFSKVNCDAGLSPTLQALLTARLWRSVCNAHCSSDGMGSGSTTPMPGSAQSPSSMSADQPIDGRDSRLTIAPALLRLLLL